MNKTILAAATLALLAAGGAQAADTLAKIKAAGSATMGVRESSGALSYTLGDGKYAGYHVEICQRVLADVQKKLGLAKLDVKYQPVTSQNRIPLGAERHRGHRVWLHHQQRHAPEGRVLRRHHLRGRSAHCGEGQFGHHQHRPAQRQERGHHHRHHLGAIAAQARKGRAWTSRKSSARTTPTASCCWKPAAPTPS
jgi:hypothetical protein